MATRFLCMAALCSVSAAFMGGGSLSSLPILRGRAVCGSSGSFRMQANKEVSSTAHPKASQKETLAGYGYSIFFNSEAAAAKKAAAPAVAVAPVTVAAAPVAAAAAPADATPADATPADAAVVDVSATAPSQASQKETLAGYGYSIFFNSEAAAKKPAAKTAAAPAVAVALAKPAATVSAEPVAAAPAAAAPAVAAPEVSNKYKDFETNWSPPAPSPTMVPEEVVKQLLTALKNNDRPSPNAGLSTVLAFSSASNPITQREPAFFFGMMQNSQYSLLLGAFETFTILSTEDLSNTGASMGGKTVAVEVSILANTQTMIDAGVDFAFMDSIAGKEQSSVNLKWQFTKDATTECWLSDTLFFVPVAKKGKTMEELTDVKTSKETARFTGTPASVKLKAQALKEPALKVQPSQLAQTALSMNLLKPTSPLLKTGMVGNLGFDPAGFAKSADLLLQYREAELKHARLAMLAVVGWIVSETVHTPLANLFGANSLLQEGADSVAEKVPTVLNGGLESIQPTFWVAFSLFAGVAEAWRMLTIAENPMNFTPGAIGFDPLGLFDKEDAVGKRAMQLKELNNGRLAMVAVAYFSLFEKFSDSAIINVISFLPKTGNILEEVAEDVIGSLML